MDAYHLLLGRLWQYDRRVHHDGRANIYSFVFEGIKIVLLPYKQSVEQPKSTSDVAALLSRAQFDKGLLEAEKGYVLMGKEVLEYNTIPESMAPLIIEFSELFPEVLLRELSHLRYIQHYIDLEPGATLPSIVHYMMNPHENEELRQHVEELLVKGHIKDSMSPCIVLALLIPKNDGSFVDKMVINKITVSTIIAPIIDFMKGDQFEWTAKFAYTVRHKVGVANRMVDDLSHKSSLLVYMHVEVLGFDSFRELLVDDPYFYVVMQDE
ncbi:uncharacterized protein LOC121979864 [Zingiber officinale]|uniref:uncharacterized protein LOC121979864 n=1 Tax=Zingiber officinale TaxID=94328 RepID=UPI001C4C45BB|nr:uncharacterized protein LOC121979864 [Zingiber officinale]